MCEQMGWEPSEEEMPIDPSFLDINAQYALLLLNALPDNWDSMGGAWLGKDYSGLSAIMDIYSIEDKREVFELLKVAEDELGKHYRQKQKEQESLAKAKRAR
jgi:hypothetical protein